MVIRDKKTGKVRIGGPAMPLRSSRLILAGGDALKRSVASGRLSGSMARVIAQMSSNEGSFDGVQAYDNQILSAGAMQKTINRKGSGELAKQLYDFSQNNPSAYKRLFAEKGWTVAHIGKGRGDGNYIVSFTDPAMPGAKALTGMDLYRYIKDPDHPDHWRKALLPFVRAGRDPAFQDQQVLDFAYRLKFALSARPVGYNRPVSDYLTSERGAALVLDECVNRQNLVPTTFGRALNAFYGKHPEASRDPMAWSVADRRVFEPEIIEAYRIARNTDEPKKRMTHPQKRYRNIVKSPLSADPGSFKGLETHA